MPMTENELGELDKLLRRMEKNAKAWTYTRWLSVVLGLLFLGLGAEWLLMKLPDAQRALMPRDFSAPVDAFDLLSTINSAIDICMLWALGLFQVAIGVNLLTSILCRWRKGHHDLLLAKMARTWLES